MPSNATVALYKADPLVRAKAQYAPHPPNRFSASKIETFRRCALRGFWRYTLGIEEPQSEAMRQGIAVHEHIERYLKHGTLPPDDPLGKCASAIIPRIPEKGPRVLAEQWFTLHLDGDLGELVGKIDLLDLRQVTPVAGCQITDVKTTSGSLTGRMRSEGALQRDTQAQCYALGALALHAPRGKGIAYRLVIAHRKTCAVKECGTLFEPEAVVRAYENLNETAKRIRSAYQTPPGKQAYNLSACNDFGGCAYRARCAGLGIDAFGKGPNPVFAVTQNRDINMGAWDDLDEAFGDAEAFDIGQPNPPDGPEYGALPSAEDSWGEPAPAPAPVKRGPGRPPGSKNKPPDEGSVSILGMTKPEVCAAIDKARLDLATRGIPYAHLGVPKGATPHSYPYEAKSLSKADLVGALQRFSQMLAGAPAKGPSADIATSDTATVDRGYLEQLKGENAKLRIALDEAKAAWAKAKAASETAIGGGAGAGETLTPVTIFVGCFPTNANPIPWYDYLMPFAQRVAAKMEVKFPLMLAPEGWAAVATLMAKTPPTADLHVPGMGTPGAAACVGALQSAGCRVVIG